jgi:hypothetical protein
MRRTLALSFLSGAHFAILQTSYFLVLEAFVSSQALSYFIAVFFWLVGLLVGLRLPRERWFRGLLLAGTASYYATWYLARVMPFATSMYAIAGACSIVSGVLPGYFFRFVGARVRPVSRALFHENNGFLAGLLFALLGATRFGAGLVAWGPAIGCAVVALSVQPADASGSGSARSN